ISGGHVDLSQICIGCFLNQFLILEITELNLTEPFGKSFFVNNFINNFIKVCLGFVVNCFPQLEWIKNGFLCQRFQLLNVFFPYFPLLTINSIINDIFQFERKKIRKIILKFYKKWQNTPKYYQIISKLVLI